MAKTETPKKPRWYRNLYDAFQFVRANDRIFFPLFLALVAVFIAGGIALGFVQGGLAGHIMSNLIGISMAALAGIILLSTRVEKAAFNRFEGMFGGSLPAVQTIRRNWKFEDDPVEVDAKGRAVVFQGVGRGGLVLVGEGDATARRLMVSARQRLQRIVPGVAIHEFYVGKGQGQTPIRQPSQGDQEAQEGARQARARRRRGPDARARRDPLAHPQGHRSDARPPEPQGCPRPLGPSPGIGS